MLEFRWFDLLSICCATESRTRLLYVSARFTGRDSRRGDIRDVVSTYTVSQKNVLTLKRYSSKLQGAIVMKFGRNIQNTLE